MNRKTRSGLVIVNQTDDRAKLRLHCGRYPMWSLGLDPGAHIRIPRLDVNHHTLRFSAEIMDDTDVLYTSAPLTIASTATTLLAKMMVHNDGYQFSLVAEPGTAPRRLGLLNLTRVPSTFRVEMVDTPFQVTAVVEPGQEESVSLKSFTISATVNGITTASQSLSDWRGALNIILDEESELERYTFLHAARVRNLR